LGGGWRGKEKRNVNYLPKEGKKNRHHPWNSFPSTLLAEGKGGEKREGGKGRGTGCGSTRYKREKEKKGRRQPWTTEPRSSASFPDRRVRGKKKKPARGREGGRRREREATTPRVCTPACLLIQRRRKRRGEGPRCWFDFFFNEEKRGSKGKRDPLDRKTNRLTVFPLGAQTHDKKRGEDR